METANHNNTPSPALQNPFVKCYLSGALCYTRPFQLSSYLLGSALEVFSLNKPIGNAIDTPQKSLAGTHGRHT